ncbi:MAG: competence/damage-inducible protein A [Ignavibacteria bacterium]
MRAQIITIGDEILIGQTLNTNAAYIGDALTKAQISVVKTIVVGDDETAILEEFKTSFDRSDIVIVTGGLGPTHDDITKSCIVKFFNSELVHHEEVMQDVKNIFLRRGRKMPDVNKAQALVPKIARIIRNQRGTAPGIWIKKNKKIFISLPGVPHEMKAMIDNDIIPELTKLNKNKDMFIKLKNLLITGIGESALFELLGDIGELLHGSRMAFLPSQFGVKLRITVEEAGEEVAINKLSEIEQKIRFKAGKYIYGTEDETLEGVVGRLLNERGLSLAVAESCTGGMISNRLTNIPGSSSYFERGIISYSNVAKVEVLKVNEDELIQNGAVSPESAKEMAEGVRSISGTDIGLSVTGILGPAGATKDKPVGLVYIGICDDKTCMVEQFFFGEDRLLNKDRASQAALDMLRRYLLGIS